MAPKYLVDPHPKADPQLEAMIADPEAYFARAREEAEAEAVQYVKSERRRLRHADPRTA